MPQEEYEKAAQLDITPSPDVVLRIFMIFKGINKSASGSDEWKVSVEKAEEHPDFWRDIVGLGDPSMSDTSKFRVLEWGGMEVKN